MRSIDKTNFENLGLTDVFAPWRDRSIHKSRAKESVRLKGGLIRIRGVIEWFAQNHLELL